MENYHFNHLPSDSVMYGLTTETSIDLANANRILMRSKYNCKQLLWQLFRPNWASSVQCSTHQLQSTIIIVKMLLPEVHCECTMNANGFTIALKSEGLNS